MTPIDIFIKIDFVTWIRIRMRIRNTYPDPDQLFKSSGTIRIRIWLRIRNYALYCTVQYSIRYSLMGSY
jgi:hypothetical protein